MIELISTALVTLIPLSDGKGHAEKCHSTFKQVAMNCSYCIAILLTKDIPTVSWFALVLDSTYVYRYQGALLPVELSQRHPLLFLRKVSKPTTHPDIGATQGFQAVFCLRRTFPLHCLPVASRSLQTTSTRLGCCLYRGMVQFGIPVRYSYPTSYAMRLPW